MIKGNGKEAGYEANSIKYSPKSKGEFEKDLTPLQFDVTQRNGTEPPFKNEYYDNFEKGMAVIYL